MERKLAAILAADVVGYTRLMERDEADTFERLRAHRKDLFEPKIAQHNGHIFKLMGDGLLAEFGSLVDAVECAVVLQRSMAERNSGVPEDRRIDMRIGVNLGDVIVEGEDRYGDGVNIAARLQQLAEPGSICVSQTVVAHVKNKLALGFEALGDHQVKNISEPVSVYRVAQEPTSGPWPTLPRRPRQRRRQWASAAAAAVLLAIAGIAVWQRPWAPRVESAAVERMAFPLPDKPSIAILPFANLSGDPEQEYFADGMTEDLITDLSKLSGIFVISRNSTWTYKGKPVKVQQVAEDLGVQYVLEGSVRRDGDQVRINAQLIDALSGHHRWAERYDGSAAEVFSLQDQVIRQIVAALAITLTPEESAQVAKAETDVLQAYDAFLQGWDHYRRNTEEDTLKSISLFEKAIERDPEYGRAYAALAAANWRIALSGWFSVNSAGIGFQHALHRMNQNLTKAMEKSTSLAFAISAEVLGQQGRYNEAFAQIGHAMALAPNDPDNYISKAKILIATGRAAEAEETTRWAMRLNPQYPPDYLRVLAIALFHQERYQDALVTVERVLSRQSDWADDYALLVSTLGHLGRAEGVDAAVKKYNELAFIAGNAPLTVQEGYWWFNGDAFDYDASYVQRIVEGRRKAGIQEGAGTDLAFADYRQLLRKSEGEYDVVGAMKIDLATAKALQERGVVFVDVRGAGEFARGHIPGAVNLDLVVALSKDSLSRVVDKNDEVAFSCHGKYCPYSAYASAKAMKWGFTRVYYFADGFPGWKDAGYPVEVSP